MFEEGDIIPNYQKLGLQETGENDLTRNIPLAHIKGEPVTLKNGNKHVGSC